MKMYLKSIQKTSGRFEDWKKIVTKQAEERTGGVMRNNARVMPM